MTGQTRRRARVAMGMSLVALLGTSLWPGAGVGSAQPTAETAAKRRTLSVVDTIRLTLVRKNGSVLYERGTATGTLPGRVTARFVTSVTKVTGTVTFYPTGGGSLTLTAVGYPKSTATVARFSGNMAVLRGTGKYARALGSGTFTGTVNRRTWAVTVYARARLTY
jgi:hypothetical protein